MTDEMKNVFIYLVCPINHKYKPFIVHLHPHQNGQANKDIQDNINIILQKFENSIFDIRYISCDGDTFYQSSFDSQFNEFMKHYHQGMHSELFQFIRTSKSIWISDPLHLWKNCRTRLLFNQIVMNPFSDSSSINAQKINQILELGPILSDYSSIGKMRDGYATALFTFVNSLKLLEIKDNTSFVYIFITALWNEALLNTHLSPRTRQYLLLTLLDILVKIYDKQSEGLPDNVGYKKSEDVQFVTMFTPAKLKRWIPTVAVLAYEIEIGNYDTGLERVGSHCIEEMIGIIRVLCRYDHRIEKIYRSAATFSLMREIADDLFPNRPKRTRLNNGGCKLFNGDKEIHFSKPYYEISSLILSLIGYSDPQPEEEVVNFIKALISFVTIAPYSPSNLPSNNSNRSILDRYHSQKPPSNDFHPKRQQRYRWTNEDEIIIDKYLLEGKEKELFTVFEGRKKRSIRQNISKRKLILAQRPIEPNEIPFLDKCIFEKYPPSSIIQFLKIRTLNSVQQMISIRYQFIQSTGYQMRI